MVMAKTVKGPHAYREIAAFLQLPERDTRPSVLATALSWVKSLNTECVEATLESSTFDLNDLLEGKPISIYRCIPPDKLTSHKALLKMWIAALMTTVLRRTSCPEKKTLFILDECAQLGTMPLLEQAVTLLRGYGLQVWTFWQDMEQVRANYPIEQCKNNLKQIGLAFHDYHDKFGSFPPAYTVDSNGRLLHSWRSLLLPYLAQQSWCVTLRFTHPTV